MKVLLTEYRKSYEGLKKMLNTLNKQEQEIKNLLNQLSNEQLEHKLELIKNDKTVVNSMMRSTEKIIKWIDTGVNPYFQQGIDVKYSYDITHLSNMDIIPDISEQLKEEREELKITEEKRHIIKEVFKVLSNRERDCVILHIAHGYSMSETGEMLNINKSTVNTHIIRARQKIERVVRL